MDTKISLENPLLQSKSSHGLFQFQARSNLGLGSSSQARSEASKEGSRSLRNKSLLNKVDGKGKDHADVKRSVSSTESSVQSGGQSGAGTFKLLTNFQSLTENKLLKSQSLGGKPTPGPGPGPGPDSKSGSLKVSSAVSLSLQSGGLKPSLFKDLRNPGLLSSKPTCKPTSSQTGSILSAGHTSLSMTSLKHNIGLSMKATMNSNKTMVVGTQRQLSSDKPPSLLVTNRLASRIQAKDENMPLPTETTFEIKQSRPEYVFTFEDENTFVDAELSKGQKDEFSDRKTDAQKMNKQKELLDKLKVGLINKVAVSLLMSPDFHSKHDPVRKDIMKVAKEIADMEPEFILKVALYTRRDLNIRVTANFLTAVAAFYPHCRPYLRKYFSKSIMLPSDWIDVAEIYQTFHDKSINFGSLPTALRKAMTAKFPDFDEYQLAKYNKDKSKKKKGKPRDQSKGPKEVTKKEKEKDLSSGSESGSKISSDSSSESEEERERKSFTLKQLIRKLHISEPVYHVMCLVGKKYPEDVDSFYRTRLPGTWEQEKAGKRMRLATPETWETQVSLKGNKASTWEMLLDHRKLPFMAMLRNLRNMIKSGMDEKHHKMVLKKLTDERSVINSKQFPFRFFSAYEILDELEKALNESENDPLSEVPPPPPSAWGAPPSFLPSSSRGRARGRARGIVRGRGVVRGRGIVRGRGRGRGARNTYGVTGPGPVKYDVEMLQRYRKALDSALQIATCHNVKPIPGTTLILCDIDYALDRPCTSARGLGKPRTVLEVGLLLSLMCKYSCEECKLFLVHDGKFKVPKFQKIGTILSNMTAVMDEVNQLRQMKTRTGSISDYLQDVLAERTQVDNIILVGSNESYNFVEGSQLLLSYCAKYRNVVNERLLYAQIDLAGRFTSAMESGDPRNITICGYSDQILRYVAERGNSGQLLYIENIDLAYDVRDIKILSLRYTTDDEDFLRSRKFSPTVETLAPFWRNIRVFISSTFRDMHGERDLLTRYVFPELRARAMQHLINVYEVDLRWGITEEESKSQKQVEICLSEVNRSDLFVGILGGRYGWIPFELDLSDYPEFDRLKNVEDGVSITELEITLFALSRVEEVKGKAFFYFRDQSFEGQLPDDYVEDFRDKNPEKLKNLKAKIRSTGLEIFSRYPCSWGGVVDGKPIVSRLEEFGTRVLNNVWTAIKKNYIEETDTLEEQSVGACHTAFADKEAERFVGRKSLVKQCMVTIETSVKSRCGILLVTGRSGSGKTAFMAKLYKEYTGNVGFAPCYFADALTESRNVNELVKHLFVSINAMSNAGYEVPDSYRDLQTDFVELLKEVGKKAGTEPIVVFVDGLDLLEGAGQKSVLGWIPDHVPQGILFVLSCVQNGFSYKLLQSRKQGLETVNVGPLDMAERSEFVRNVLGQHRKTLDESAFNNQMKLLVSKREASLPLFLKFACEELRFFGLYEKMSDHLRRLAQTVPQLLLTVAQRLEMDHGKELVSKCLLTLQLSRQALTEDELYEVLCALEQADSLPLNKLSSREVYDLMQAKSESVVSRASFARLSRALRGFTQQAGEQGLQISFNDVRDLVNQKYVKGSQADTLTRIHRVLAGYYRRKADTPRGTWRGKDPKAFTELPYHLACGGLWKELEDVLCCLSFIKGKLESGLGSQLLEDFLADVSLGSRLQERMRDKFLETSRVKETKENYISIQREHSIRFKQEYHTFVSRNIHILNRFPILLFQQALNDSKASSVYEEIKHISGKGKMVQWLNKPVESSPIRMTITGFSQSVTSVCISPEGRLLACGTQDGEVRLFEFASGKDVGNLVGHSGSITSCCFINPLQLCSASADGTLSVWDVTGGHRKHLLKGHRRAVAACAPVPQTQNVVSVSWDCTARIWSSIDGREMYSFQGGGHPLNCVSCDSEGKFIAMGGWDSQIKIWNILENKRKTILKGHESSVRAVAFSPTGSHILSAALLGDIYVWSFSSGTRVGKYSSSAYALTQLKYTPNGFQTITAGSDSSIKVWSGALGQPAGVIRNKDSADHDYALAVTINNQGNFVVVGYHSGRVSYFDSLTDELKHTSRPHKASIKSLDFTHDGQFVITGCDDKTAKLIKYTEVCNIFAEHTEPIRCVKASAAYIATASEDFTIKLWPALFLDEETNVKSVATLRGHDGPVTCCDFSPCGSKLVSGSYDKSLVIWDAIAFKPMTTLRNCHKDWINACAWSDIGDFVVTGSNDFTVKLWDTKIDDSSKTPQAKYEFPGNSSAINSVSYKFGCVSSAAFDGTVRVWTHKGAQITTIRAHESRCNGVFIWAPPKDKVGDWSVENTDEMSKNQLMRAKQPDLDEVEIMSVSDDGLLKKWKPFKPHLVQTLNSHTDVVSDIAVTQTGKDLISSSYDMTVKCWNIQQLGKRETVHEDEVSCVRISKCGKYAVSSGRDGHVVIWNLESENDGEKSNIPEIRCTIKQSSKSINSVAFVDHPHEENIAVLSGGNKGILDLWSLEGSEISSMRTRNGPVFNITSVDKNIIWSSFSQMCYVSVFEMRRGRPTPLCDLDNSWFLDSSVSSDGKQLNACTTDGQIYRCSALKGNKISLKTSLFMVKRDYGNQLSRDSDISEAKEPSGDDKVWPLRTRLVSTDVSGKDNLICGMSDGSIRFLVIDSLQQAKSSFIPEAVGFKSFQAHEKGITGLQVTDHLIITASLDTTIKVWDKSSLKIKDDVSLNQVGLFFCRGPITYLDAKFNGKTTLIVVGDKMGNVEFLDFTL